MKFVHKLHDPTPLPWKTWFLHHTTSMDDSFLCRLINAELHRYRSLTSVRIGDGQLISFWHDKWILGTTLAQAFPALYSHCTRTSDMVGVVLTRGLVPYLRPRLTRVAREELNILQNCVQVSPLSDRTDQRFLDDLAHSPFTTQGAYRSLHINDERHPDAARIWATRLPGKVKFFGWLLLLGRLNTGQTFSTKTFAVATRQTVSFAKES